MAKKKSFFGTLLKLGGVAAATAVVYSKREEIRGFLNELAGQIVPESTEPKFPDYEPEIIIDATAKAEEEKAEEKPED